MESLSDRQEASIKSATECLFKEIQPYLAAHQASDALKRIIAHELTSYEVHAMHERSTPFGICIAIGLVLIAGFTVGRLTA